MENNVWVAITAVDKQPEIIHIVLSLWRWIRGCQYSVPFQFYFGHQNVHIPGSMCIFFIPSSKFFLQIWIHQDNCFFDSVHQNLFVIVIFQNISSNKPQIIESKKWNMGYMSNKMRSFGMFCTECVSMFNECELFKEKCIQLIISTNHKRTKLKISDQFGNLRVIS